MTCEDSTQLLPWLLNGSLEPDERSEVLRHLATCATCRQTLADTRLAWRLFDQHIPAEALVAHAWGEETGLDRDVLAAHLASCPQCSDELELIDVSRRLEGAEDERVALFPPAAPPAPPTLAAAAKYRPAAGTRLWRNSALAAALVGLLAATGWLETSRRVHTLETAMETRSMGPAALRGSAPASRPAPERLHEAEKRMAAISRENQRLRQQTEALGARQQGLERQLAQLERPPAGTPAATGIEANGATLSPPPLTSVERGPGAGEIAELRSAAPFNVITLQTSHEEHYGSYVLEIQDARGKVVTARKLARDSPGAEFVLLVHKGMLAKGKYTLKLYGTRDGERALLDSYAIKVV